MSVVGFGGYRISVKSEEHEKALQLALDEGIKYIDTSSNYTDGESEELIGKLLKAHWKSKPHIISKVGYVQGKNLEIIKDFPSELTEISNDLKHSIHPDFIEDQVLRSLSRLAVPKIDTYLLHNPEYYLKTEGSTKEEYYRRIKNAFIKLEELVEKELIGSYGISSNTFVDPREEHEATDLDQVLKCALEISDEHNFKYIQFPMNALEMGALERQYDGEHLIERANSYGLKTIINRPLNCFTEQGLLRLATYDIDPMYETGEHSDKLFTKAIEPLVVKWLTVREDEGDKLFDIPLMKQITSMWHTQNSLDAVDHVFMGYFFPLIANIWGSDLSPKESQSFYELYEHARNYALVNMNKRAKQFEKQAIDKGLLFESDLSLSQKVIEKYQSFGLDIILVGMKKESYVRDMKTYF